MTSPYATVFALLVAGATCVLASQSPIDIKTKNCIRMTGWPPLSFKHYNSSQKPYYLSNTGHGCEISLNNWQQKPRVKGGPLASTFVLQQAHFHWGDSDNVGSEHRLNGEAFSMEAHLVHWNSKYESYEEASTKADGLAVIAFFIEACDQPNPYFQEVVDLIPQVVLKGSGKVKSDKDLLAWATSCLEGYNYYYYRGSLTTEPYSENVSWLVFDNPIIIAKSQITAFRSIKSKHNEPLTSNYRALQNATGVNIFHVVRPRAPLKTQPASVLQPFHLVIGVAK